MSPMKFNHKVDGNSGATVFIDLDHAEIHEGDGYFTSNYATVASGGETLFYVKTPNSSKRAHMQFLVESNLPGLLYFYEGFTMSGTTAGTSVAVYNFDRNSTNTSGCTAFHTPLVSSGGYGITLKTRVVGGGTSGGGSSRVGGAVRTSFEYIAKPNAEYLLRFVADTNGTRVVSIAEWYELD